MATPDETIIETSKRKTIKILFYGTVFVALGIWMLTLDAEVIERHWRYNDPTFVYSVGIGTIIFFGLCVVFLIKRALDRSPGLIFNRDGFTDNSSAVSLGFVPWSDVAEIETTTIRVGLWPARSKQEFISIHVIDQDKYAEKGNLFQRLLNQANLRMTGTQINISVNTLKISHEDLHSIFEKYFTKYGDTA